MNRRTFFKASAAAAVHSTAALAASTPPNIVLILADDLGYGDLGCYGSHIRTPNLDRMASEGVLLKQFCAASPVCSPSRAGLMTGRYGVRVGVPNVLGPGGTSGLSESETTIAEVLKPAGYRSACVGKWHLGSQARFLPAQRGFDEFHGMLFSNDQGPCTLMRNAEVLETQAPLDSLTQWFTARAVDFIRRSKDGPFFLYMAHTAPHMPLVASAMFRGKSRAGVYGDVVQEMDWSVGQVLAELSANGLDDNTLVIFTSDNGPWFQGTAGRLRGRKGDTFEGGLRVPFLARYKGRIPEGSVSNGFATLLDLLPTFAALAQSGLPARQLDGVNILPILMGEMPSVERQPFLYFDSLHLQCARVGQWKLHLSRNNTAAFTAEPKAGRANYRLVFPELYDVETDPAESTDESSDYPEVVAAIRDLVNQMLPSFPVEVQTAWNATRTRAVIPNQPGVWPEGIP
jgi:arylsulfatase A